MKQSDRRNQSTRKLITAFLELAAEQGVASITFDNIGERAGYSRGLASQKFGSKNGLLEAAISQLHDEMAEIREEAHLEDRPGLESLLLYCDVHLTTQEEFPQMRAYFILYSAAVAELSDMRPLFVKANERTRNDLVSIIERGKKDGSIRTDINAKKVAALIGNMLGGLANNAIIDPAFRIDRMGPEVRQMIISSYAANP